MRALDCGAHAGRVTARDGVGCLLLRAERERRKIVPLGLVTVAEGNN